MRGIGGRQACWPGSLGLVGRRRLGSHGGWPHHKHGRSHVTGNAVAVPAPSLGLHRSAVCRSAAVRGVTRAPGWARGRLPVLYGMNGGFVIFCSGKKCPGCGGSRGIAGAVRPVARQPGSSCSGLALFIVLGVSPVRCAQAKRPSSCSGRVLLVMLGLDPSICEPDRGPAANDPRRPGYNAVTAADSAARSGFRSVAGSFA